MKNFKKINIDRIPRLLFTQKDSLLLELKSKDSSLFERIMTDLKQNGILSIEDLCKKKETELYEIKPLSKEIIDLLKKELLKFGLSLGMSENKLIEYKKGILNVSVATTHNGYSLVTTKNGIRHEHLFFNLKELLSGFMYHVGLGELEAIDKKQIDFFVNASQKWEDMKECVLDNIKKEEDIKSLEEKVNNLTNENDYLKRSYERETNKLKEKHAKEKDEIRTTLNKKISEKESELIEAKYEMTKQHNQEITELKASNELKISQVNELHKKEVEELNEQIEKLKAKPKRNTKKQNLEITDLKASYELKINEMNELHKKEVEELNEQIEKLKAKPKRKSKKQEKPEEAKAT